MNEPETEQTSSESTEKPLSDSPPEEQPKKLTRRQRYALAREERLKKDPDAPYGRHKNGAPRGKTGPKPRDAALIKPLPTTIYDSQQNSDRVMEALDMMRKLKFVRGKSNKELALKWGVSPSYAADLTARAAKLLREEVTHQDIVGATIGESLMTIVKQGMRSKKFADRKLVIMAARVLSELSPGLRAPAEHKVNVANDGLPDDPEKLLAIARELVRQNDGTEYMVVPEVVSEAQ